MLSRILADQVDGLPAQPPATPVATRPRRRGLGRATAKSLAQIKDHVDAPLDHLHRIALLVQPDSPSHRFQRRWVPLAISFDAFELRRELRSHAAYELMLPDGSARSHRGIVVRPELGVPRETLQRWRHSVGPVHLALETLEFAKVRSVVQQTLWRPSSVRRSHGLSRGEGHSARTGEVSGEDLRGCVQSHWAWRHTSSPSLVKVTSHSRMPAPIRRPLRRTPWYAQGTAGPPRDARSRSRDAYTAQCRPRSHKFFLELAFFHPVHQIKRARTSCTELCAAMPSGRARTTPSWQPRVSACSASVCTISSIGKVGIQ